MNCQEFEVQIALYVGNDLEEKEILVVEKHLANCLNCKQFMAEMQDSQLAFAKFSNPEIDEQIFSDLRASVLTQISLEKQKTSWWKELFGFQIRFWQYATAFSLLVGLLAMSGYLVLVSDKQQSTVAKINQEEVRSSDVKTVNKKTTNIDNKTPYTKEEQGYQPSKIARTISKNVNYIKPKRNSVSSINNVKAEDNKLETTNISIASKSSNDNGTNLKQEPIKLEIQTKNPNIRIIWFTTTESKGAQIQANS